MIHVALTCPRLLFTIGLRADLKPARRHMVPALIAALEDRGGEVSRGIGVGWFSVALADSVDAVLALQGLQRTLDDYHFFVQSVIGSAAALELLADPGAAHAWGPLHAQIHYEAPTPGGIAALRHFRELHAWPVPDAIRDGQLPEGPLVLWQPGKCIVVVDHEPFVIGKDPMCDLVIGGTAAPRHASLSRSTEGWMIRDIRAGSGITIDGQRPLNHAELRPGMVVQFTRPDAFVVLSVQPAR